MYQSLTLHTAIFVHHESIINIHINIVICNLLVMIQFSVMAALIIVYQISLADSDTAFDNILPKHIGISLAGILYV